MTVGNGNSVSFFSNAAQNDNNYDTKQKITDDENQCSTMKDHRVVAYHKGRMLGVVQKALMVHLDEHKNFPTDLNSPAQEQENIHLNVH